MMGDLELMVKIKKKTLLVRGFRKRKELEMGLKNMKQNNIF